MVLWLNEFYGMDIRCSWICHTSSHCPRPQS